MHENRALPSKKREIRNHHFDSTIWNDLTFLVLLGKCAKLVGYSQSAQRKFIHFNDLKRDMAGQMRSIAAFLDIPVIESNWTKIVQYCTFDWMKKNAKNSVPLGGAFWEGGAEVFINKGVNGRWVDTLTSEEVAEYEACARHKLGFECADWIANGTGIF